MAQVPFPWSYTELLENISKEGSVRDNLEWVYLPAEYLTSTVGIRCILDQMGHQSEHDTVGKKSLYSCQDYGKELFSIQSATYVFAL